MRRDWLALLLAVVVMGSSFGVAFAQDEGGILAADNFSSTLTFTTEYMYDGVSISDQDPAVQGSMDYCHAASGIFLGLWGSSWDDGGYSNDIELGVWGGQAGSLGPIDYDLTLYYWFYPGAQDDGFEFDYFQAGINAGHTFADMVLSPTITVGYMWSPDFFGEEGTYHKFSGKLGFSLVYGVGLEFEAAHVDIEGGATTGNGGGMDGGDGYDWEFYRIGLSKELIASFNVDLSYYVNSEKEYFEAFYGGEDVADPRLVFTLSRTF
ncbi:putative membrane protein [Desulfosarcina variabilis str. Montpellier]|uniref:TorF family putative porin n=1 Tax=Desulfosarcina variabilis TaxID=2300 RepID=UPI003AFA220D